MANEEQWWCWLLLLPRLKEDIHIGKHLDEEQCPRRAELMLKTLAQQRYGIQSAGNEQLSPIVPCLGTLVVTHFQLNSYSDSCISHLVVPLEIHTLVRTGDRFPFPLATHFN